MYDTMIYTVLYTMVDKLNQSYNQIIDWTL